MSSPTNSSPAPVESQITFLYYEDLAPIVEFYEQVLGFAPVEDQEFARIYRVSERAFVGIVAGERGFHRPQPQNAVLITLAVADVDVWYAHLQAHNVPIVRELATIDSIQVRCFFFRDPGGYTYEAQTFLKPELQAIFHRA